MKKTSMLFALAAVVGAAAVSQAAVVTTVTRSVGSELVAAAGTSGIPANAASAIYELGSGQSFSIGGTFTVKLTNARFAANTGIAICNGTSALAFGSSAATSTTITLTASQIVPAFTAYQLFAGTSGAAACGTSGSVGLPVEINGTDPVQVAIDSTDVPAATAPAVDLYKTQKQFTAALTLPASAVIDFNATPANSLFVANTSATPPVTTTSVPAGYVVYSNQALDMKLDINGTSLANTACVAGAAFGTSYMSGTSVVGAIPGGGVVNIAATVKGNFAELALAGTSAAAGPVSFGVGASTSAPTITYAGPVVSSTSTSAASGTSLTGTSVNICGSAATATSAAASLNDVVLNKTTSTSVVLVPRTFTTGVDIAVGTSKIFTLFGDTTSHNIVLNTTRYYAPTVKSSDFDDAVQSWFKFQLVKTAAASTAKVNVTVLLADGTYYTLNNFKTLTAGVTTAFGSKEIVDAVLAQSKVLPKVGTNYTFAAIIEVESMNDNLYAYASQPNNNTGSFTRIPLRILQGGAVPALMSVW